MRENKEIRAENASIFKRKVTLDVKAFFRAVSESVFGSLTGNPVAVTKGLKDMTLSLGLDKSPEALAFDLLIQAISKAFNDVLENCSEHISKINCVDVLDFNRSIVVLGDKYEIDLEELFLRPKEISFIKDLQVDMTNWLVSLNFSRADAKSIAGQLPANFVYWLNQIWRENAKDFKVILDHRLTPFTDSLNKENDWNLYFSYLERMLAQPVFGETFTLRQIYIAPLATSGPSLRTAVNLTMHLRSWLLSKTQREYLMIVTGGPGAGKSTFLKMFCAETMGDAVFRVLYLPIYALDFSKGIQGAVRNYISDQGILRHDPLSDGSQERNILLAFDGYDELASQTGVAVEKATSLLKELQTFLSTRNSGAWNIRAILTGREALVQHSSKHLNESQVLQLLPYKLSIDELSHISNREFASIDRRDEWWRRYGALTGKNFDKLPEQFATQQMHDITSQPLLNHLLAVANSNTEIFDATNINIIYAALIRRVYERAYENRRFRPIEDYTFDQFHHLLQEIAIVAFQHGDERSAPFSALKVAIRDRRNEYLNIEKFAERDAIGFLASFFFRTTNYEKNLEGAAFVFTHRTFAEYLIVKKIINELEENSCDEFERYDNWVNLFAGNYISPATLQFFAFELQLNSEQARNSWRSVICEILEFSINRINSQDHDFDRKKLSALFNALLLLDAIPAASGPMNSIKISNSKSFAQLLRELALALTNRKEFGMVPITRVDIQKANFSGCTLSYFFFENCNLSFSDLRGFKGTTVSFLSSILQNANLSFSRATKICLDRVVGDSIKLLHSRFVELSANDANLGKMNANLLDAVGASFERTNLTSAELKMAVLTGANFRGATLASVNMEGAHFCSADFSQALMMNAKLARSDGTFAKFFRANLQGADMRNGVFIRAVFDNATLEGADLRGANLTRSVFTYANLVNANFAGADLRHADFRGADLAGIDLQGANLDGAIMS